MDLADDGCGNPEEELRPLTAKSAKTKIQKEANDFLKEYEYPFQNDNSAVSV